jgi:hypothetical protein
MTSSHCEGTWLVILGFIFQFLQLGVQLHVDLSKSIDIAMNCSVDHPTGAQPLNKSLSFVRAT